MTFFRQFARKVCFAGTILFVAGVFDEIGSARGATDESAEVESQDESDRSLLNAVLGFESEIESENFETREAIDLARRESGLLPTPETPEQEGEIWESAPTSLE